MVSIVARKRSACIDRGENAGQSATVAASVVFGCSARRIDAVEGGLAASALFAIDRGDVTSPDRLRVAADAPALPEQWRSWLLKRAERTTP